MDPRLVKAKLDILRRRATVAAWPVTPWQARTADHPAPGVYHYDGDWALVAGDSSCWPAGKSVFLRTQTKAPEGVPPGDLFLQFEMQALEGLLSVNGRPYAGLDANHTRIALTATGTLDLEAEFISVPTSYRGQSDEQGRLKGVAWVQSDHEVLGAYYDLWFTWEAARQAPDEGRRQLLDMVLEDALLAIDVTAPPERLAQEVAAARRLWWERIAAIPADPGAGRILLTGHSHIDTAWLWPLRETVRKCARTFSTACRLLERYPDYYFSCSQPQLYAYARRHYPQLYAEVKKWVQARRWECTGGMWVEADCNATSGESLIRQVLLGLRFFREEFGARPRSCWLPDAFGFPASLPQILRGCGLDFFYTNKLHWQARNPLPSHLFWWEGLNGSRVLAHVPRLPHYYNGFPNPEQLNLAWRDYLQKAPHPELLFPFGYGDGGGGPTEEMLEFAARAARFPGLPACRQGLEEAYFDGVVAAAPDLPAWVGELYLETHRGTLTSQGAIKRANRRGELLLREAEIAGTLARLSGAAVDLAPLGPAWENLLLLQFHDILPGTSIGEVYHEAAQDHAQIEATACRVRDVALSTLATRSGVAGDIVAFNSLSWARSDVASATVAEPEGPVELVGPGGPLPAQVVARRDGQAEIIFAPDLPPLGLAGFGVRRAMGAAETSLRVSERRLESRHFLLDLDEEGQITRLLDRRCDREVVPAGQVANRLQLFQDGPEREAAWNVHATFEKREYAWDPGAQLEVLEAGPVRAVVRLRKRYRQSYLEQDIVLYDRLPRIDFVTRVDWQERQVMLKAAFPLEVRSARATYEVQFGAVERATHRNTTWEQEKFEVCGQRWADLSEPGYGVSLLNDCKYGYDVRGHTLRLTLLRGPEWPDPNADRGQHEFTYALLPHSDDWVAGETVRRAWELNVPVTCLPGRGGGVGAARSFFQVEGPAIVETLKPAEDGDGLILRLYEPYGGRGRVRVRAAQAMRRVRECNLVEENEAELAVEAAEFAFPIQPFEIRTFRLQTA